MDVSALLPAAVEAAQTLNRQRIPLTRTTLARQLRADGHPLSTAAATILTRLLRHNPLTQPDNEPTASSTPEPVSAIGENPLPVKENP